MNSTELYKMHNGEPVITIAGMALLLGVPEAELRAETARQAGDGQSFTQGTFQVPETWVKNGRRRARETMAAIGSDSMRDALDYLAAQEAVS